MTELLDVDALVPAGRAPDFVEEGEHVWHYGQTDANRHVNGMEYLRVDGALRRRRAARRRPRPAPPLLLAGAHRLSQAVLPRRGVPARRAWFRGEAPLVVAGAFQKAADPPDARPAVAVELTMGQHAAGMISTGDFKRGLRILVDGDPYVILDVHVQSPSARGASSLSKIKVRNLRTGQVLDKTFRGGDRVEEPDMELRAGAVPLPRRRRLPLHGHAELRAVRARRPTTSATRRAT